MRECGECVVCCVYPRIEEPLHKAAMTHCAHVQADEPEVPGKKVCFSGTGCSAYCDRPPVCKEYECAWLLGNGDISDRPDKSGVLMDRNKKIRGAVECKSLWEGAHDEPAGRAAIERVSCDMGLAALVISFGERRLREVRTW